MISIRVVACHAGASYLSPLPSLLLEVRASHVELRRLISRRGLLRDVLQSPSGIKGLDQLVVADPIREEGSAGLWIRQWLDVLFARCGFLPVVPPGLREFGAPDAQGSCTALLWLGLLPFDPAGAQTLLQWSLACWNWCLADSPAAEQRDELVTTMSRLGRRRYKASFLAMARELQRRRLPFGLEELEGTELLSIGVGAQRQRLSHKFTDRSSAWGLRHAKSKPLTKRLLVEAGLPVASGGSVIDLHAALRLAERLGYPVVSKPAAADQGYGVITAIADPQALERAWQESSRHGPEVLVERHIHGRDYRFLLVGGRLMAALERIPAGVVGDGLHTVEALLREENARRSASAVPVEGGSLLSLEPIELDGEARDMLAIQGLQPEAIPAAGQEVRLRYSANYSMGGSVRECRAEVHPANVQLLEKVAVLFRLDIVGIDVIAASIDAPIAPQGGVICEVNGLPGVLPHMLAEPGRALMAEVLDRLLQPLQPLPCIALRGDRAEELIAAVEAALLPSHPGLMVASRSGVRQGGLSLSSADATGLVAQRRLLADPSATAFVLQLDDRDLQKHGLACAAFDLLIVAESGQEEALPEPWNSWLCGRARRVLIAPTGVAPPSGEPWATELAAALHGLAALAA